MDRQKPETKTNGKRTAFVRGLGAGGGGRGAHVIHGQSRMTIDHHIPTCNAGTERVGFSPTTQTWLAPKYETP